MTDAEPTGAHHTDSLNGTPGALDSRATRQRIGRTRVPEADWTRWGRALLFVRSQVQCSVSPELLDGVLGPAVQEYVRRWCAESKTGAGPSWFQLGCDLESTIYRVVPRPPKGASDAVRLEWRRRVVQTVMPLLRRAGWVDYVDNVAGSLRPGPVPQLLLSSAGGGVEL